MRRAAIVAPIRTPVGKFLGSLASIQAGDLGAIVIQALIERTGMGWDDIDLVELNEAFAPQVLAVLKGWGWDERDRLNVNGSGISLGHPIGATGGRILANLLRELKRRDGKYGLETMCIGGGQGIAAIFERA